ncbi:alpha/beta hydrolase [Streptomyces sp. IMTB 2501]|uniref:RBBP9/YdeN family alpha/beta hydrolase n=1 Tax=Streptomyces sp. IMTB 2501 TaxID=1776340 RepID=UPI00096E0CD0|nr:alpha/beta hydrolase [Streptomyces sp. IMTB 2501]OLZ74181.1 alpha/beta hydrolase [Streptomyces sp. IMTB 2501]
MSPTAEPTVVIVPGLRDHVTDHWQTLLAERLAEAGRTVRTVPPAAGNRLDLDVRVGSLDATLALLDGPVVLVAHSAGVITTVHWARRHRADVRGALLATPADLETPLPDGHPTPAELAGHGWTPVPRVPLPFPSIVAASADDPLGAPERVAELARGWGSRLVELGAVGHLNPASGYGEWSQAEELIRVLESGTASAPLGATSAGGHP